MERTAALSLCLSSTAVCPSSFLCLSHRFSDKQWLLVCFTALTIDHHVRAVKHFLWVRGFYLGNRNTHSWLCRCQHINSHVVLWSNSEKIYFRHWFTMLLSIARLCSDVSSFWCDMIMIVQHFLGMSFCRWQLWRNNLYFGLSICPVLVKVIARKHLKKKSFHIWCKFSLGNKVEQICKGPVNITFHGGNCMFVSKEVTAWGAQRTAM